MSADPLSEDSSRRRRRGERSTPMAGPARAPQPRLPFAPVEFLSRDEVELIHRAALTVLQEIGIDFLHDEAKAILEQAGADVDPASNRVRFDPMLVEAQIGKAPRQFTLHARNPERSVVVGGAHVAFCSVASAPNAFDREGGRRPGNQRDYQNFIRLSQSFDSIHVIGGYPVEPADIHASVRHLDALFDMLTLTDKPIHAYSFGRERIRDAIEMARIARGLDDATLEREPSLFTIINSSSPLRLDTPMLEGLIQMARRNQVVVLTPFTLAGAMAPVTLAGALAQQHAEALAGSGPRADRAAGFALRLRRLHLQRRHEVGRAGVRHARIHEDRDHRRAVGASARACPIARPTPTPPIRSMRRRRTKACSPCGARSWAASIC